MRWFAFVALFAACGGSKITPVDFSATNDIQLPVVSKCIGIVACASGCSTSDCVSSCEGPADSASIAAYEALVSCANAACAGGDAGSDVDGGASCDPTDSTCASCLDAATHGKSSACTTEYAACQN